MSISSLAYLSGRRKRTLSTSTFDDDDSIYGGAKRLRRDSSASFDLSMSSSVISLRDDVRRYPRTQLLRRSSSIGSHLADRISPRADTPPLYHLPEDTLFGSRFSSPLLAAEAAGPSTPTYIYSAISAKHYLRETKVVIDFTPPASPGEGRAAAPPMVWSSDNVLFFPRGSRMHYKNMSASDDSEVFQLCKLKENAGEFTALQCRADVPNVLALGTSKGNIQIWDISAKTQTLHWSTKGVASMSWNGAVLSVGSQKGAIRHFDTRINPATKMKEQAKKVTRHQGQICKLSWNVDGRLLASGDSNGIVHCWDTRARAPLDTGEFVQRRKKIQHAGPITALTWCPWKPKSLATGDSSPNGKGVIRLWDVQLPPPGSNPLATTPDSSSNAANPGRIDLDSQITGLYFSIECQELLSTHGPGPDDAIVRTNDSLANQPPRPLPRGMTGNTITVHSLPMLRHITTEPIAMEKDGVAGGCLNPTGMKMAFALPGENKIKVYEIWGKRKEVKKQPSFASCIIR